jgi:hypothetical protein
VVVVLTAVVSLMVVSLVDAATVDELVELADAVVTGANVGALAITPVDTSGSYAANTALVPNPMTTSPAPTTNDAREFTINDDERRTGFSTKR